ncbi:TPA: DUF2767 family protein [Citrobacter farmeri]|uniref:DUF2767 family protein n=1 Tax=Enterobacteriaceae TaxID=543 RepID=UPI000657B23C|nr:MULTISPECIES: DUF2767 family protein [Enterobacteriaceae]MBT1774645.1 DUF2767 family protein [Enterobacter hormaechei subsp. xiangfangensis]HCC2455807.1 DUF2767 family protein [Klebsiella variicola]HEP0886216.1 DUF2767 family protein [Klebsiella pneumoniae subsp. pneumoniae]AYL49854.1 DUF2767 domain-containing protein [Citrobacter freundii]KAF6533466.1 DUF2767 family protein [Enterobacter hormaechei]
MPENKSTTDDEESLLYDEACRMVGQCCLMLASNGAETHRDQLVYQLKRLHWKFMVETDVSHNGILFAIEQLATARDDKFGSQTGS